MKDHQAPFAIIVQVIKGTIDFGVNSDVIQMNIGDFISLKPSVVQNLIVIEENIVRLSLSKSDSVKRVKNV